MSKYVHCDECDLAIEAGELKVTPEMAEHFISTKGENRRVSNAHVSKMARDMRDGVFGHQDTPVEFRVESDGSLRLVGGLHRMMASRLAERTFVTDVRIVSPQTWRDEMKFMGAGRPQSFQDQLRKLGYQYAKEIQGFLSAFYRCVLSVQAPLINHPYGPSRGELWQLFEDLYEEADSELIHRAIKTGNRARITRGLSPVVATTSYYIVSQVAEGGESAAEEFWYQFQHGKATSGRLLTAAAPPVALRSRILNDVANMKGQSVAINKTQYFLVRATNDFLRGDDAPSHWKFYHNTSPIWIDGAEQLRDDYLG